MNDLLSTLRGVLLLEDATYQRLRDSKNAMRNGILLFLILFLIAGSLGFVVDLIDRLTPFNAEAAAEFEQEFLPMFEQFQPFMGQDEEFRQVFDQMFLENFRAGLNMGMEIDDLDTPLPKGLARFFEALGAWLSMPFARLGMLLGYGIWVLLFAKLLGGAGGVDRFFGVTAMVAVPLLLTWFQGLPAPLSCVGGVIAFLGFLWSIAVYVKAVQVTQRFDTGKAVLATFLPALIILLLAMFGLVMALIGFSSLVNAASA